MKKINWKFWKKEEIGELKTDPESLDKYAKMYYKSKRWGDYEEIFWLSIFSIMVLLNLVFIDLPQRIFYYIFDGLTSLVCTDKYLNKLIDKGNKSIKFTQQRFNYRNSFSNIAMFRKTKEVCIYAIKSDSRNIRYIDYDVVDDEFLLTYLQSCKYTNTFNNEYYVYETKSLLKCLNIVIEKGLLTDFLITKIVRDYSQGITFIPENLRTKDLYLLALSNGRITKKQVPSEYLPKGDIYTVKALPFLKTVNSDRVVLPASNCTYDGDMILDYDESTLNDLKLVLHSGCVR